jgi:hypothetical protein
MHHRVYADTVREQTTRRRCEERSLSLLAACSLVHAACCVQPAIWLTEPSEQTQQASVRDRPRRSSGRREQTPDRPTLGDASTRPCPRWRWNGWSHLAEKSETRHEDARRPGAE